MILKQKVHYRWNRKAKCNVMFVMLVIVDCIWRKPVSTYAISVLVGGFGEKIIMCTLQDRRQRKEMFLKTRRYQ